VFGAGEEAAIATPSSGTVTIAQRLWFAEWLTSASFR
jgi:hypothetical protein